MAPRDPIEHILRDLQEQREKLDRVLNDSAAFQKTTDEILEKLEELRHRARLSSGSRIEPAP